ncbi:MAG: hypothetical protein AABZ39_02400 [Spirochaetota bacterium]
MAHIRIGTLIGGNDALRVIPQILPHGFESFSARYSCSPVIPAR